MGLTGTSAAIGRMKEEDVRAALVAVQGNRAFLQSVGDVFGLRELNEDEQRLNERLERITGGGDEPVNVAGVGSIPTSPSGAGVVETPSGGSFPGGSSAGVGGGNTGGGAGAANGPGLKKGSDS